METGNGFDASEINKIYIIGNGVIAKALAVALAINGRSATILRGSVDDTGTSREHVEVDTGEDLLSAHIEISSINSYEKLDGLIVLTNKSFGNEQIARKLHAKAKHSPIVFLQNGLHIENCFSDMGFENLYRCVLMATSQTAGENSVRFRLVAASPIGVIAGSEEMLPNIVTQLNTSIFSFRTEPDIQPFIWKKVISNCVFNSICPLLEVDNGVFRRNASVVELGRKVIRECLVVAREYGISLTEDEIVQNILNISEMSDGQKISTYQDLLNKRQTEIDSLNFAMADAAKQKGIFVPVTSLLGTLIKLKSELN
ncbi:2-dehydropantoate 2-reductase [Dyadobacter sp. SG02]|uniref:ketopantoate reductase family protein n=1 Tax=Dyadobacter sp. SG02 TaxID=1855291 RepID=UPI0008D313E3|nr:2-dehydropantoate 2-reductase [Dyadobacter sp. SG02]SEJ36802.1 2-dehydropantoate 2-reductase [Dyadobacter sp. SG02]